jgi:hypothetical protein
MNEFTLHVLILAIFFIPVLLSGVFYLYAYFFIKNEQQSSTVIKPSIINPDEENETKDIQQENDEYDEYDEIDCDWPIEQISLLFFVMFGILWTVQASITSLFYYLISPNLFGILLIHFICLISIIVFPGMWQARQSQKAMDKFISQRLSSYLCQLSWSKTLNMPVDGGTLAISTVEELDEKLDQLETQQGEVIVFIHFYSRFNSSSLLHTRLGRPDTVLVYWNTQKKPYHLVAVGKNDKSNETIKFHPDDEWTYLKSHLISQELARHIIRYYAKTRTLTNEVTWKEHFTQSSI